MNDAFAHPVTVGIVAATGAVLLLAALVIGGMTLLGRGTPAFRRELWLRYGSWLVLLPLMFGPVLLGKAWTIGAVTILALLCLSEFARATGLFREYVTTAVVALGILAVNFAALDNWYRFFVALWPLTTVILLVATIPLDRPAGYIQRNALAIFAFMLLGVGLGHLGYMANDPGYRPLVLMLLAAIALNDVAAFTWGKLIGGRKLLPNTSPNKTVSGAVGALCTTTALVAFLGVLVSVAGQCGDLMLSSIKRDIGIKDMGAALPGHGGIMDRFNSLLLVAPAVFHLINYVVGIGEGQPTRVLTGG